MKLNLRLKLLISALLVLTPVLVLLIVHYRADYDLQKQELLLDQMRVAQFVSELVVDSALSEALTLDRSYVRDPVILSFDPGRINDYLAGLAPVYPEYDDVLAVFDVNGNMVGSARGFGSVNVADRQWFQNVMRTGEPVVGNLTLSRATGRPIISVAVPIKDQEGMPMGAISSAISPAQFLKRIEAIGRPAGQQVFLADPAGRLIFHTGKPELPWEERYAFSYLPVRTVLEGRPFVGEWVDSLLGDRRTVVAMPTAEYGWVVAVSMPTDLALAPVQESLRQAFMVFGAVALFTIVLALTLAELLLRPLRQLRENAVAFGRGELQRRVRIRTGDELEELANTFNRMAGEIQVREEQREEYVAEIRRAEEELRESEERYRNLVETTSDWIWEVDENALYTYASPRVRDLLGYEPEEVLGTSPFDLMPEGEAQRVAGLFGPIAAQQKPFSSLENTSRHKDGHLVVLETSGVPIFDVYGTFCGYRGVDRNITARKQAEEERERLLIEIEHRVAELNTVIESTADGIFVCDSHGLIVTVNQAGLRLVGAETKEEAQLLLADCVSRLRVQRLDGTPMPVDEDTLARALRGETFHDYEAIWHPPKEQPIYVQASGAPIHDEAGRVVGGVAVVIDTTKLRQMDRLKDEFISIASHELRTPITLIKGYASTLLRGVRRAGAEGYTFEALEVIDEEADRMADMINKLLNVSRIQAGRLVLYRQPVDLVRIVEQRVRRIQATARRHSVSVEPEAPSLIGEWDEAYLAQVIDNLLQNAIKYSPDGGPVTVQIQEKNGEACVSVRDEGIGVPPEKQPYLFQRFYRVSEEAQAQRGGLGLGLYISHEIVSLHGGRMWVDSAVGRGSTFHFTLPLGSPQG